jgi:hypothetical protein
LRAGEAFADLENAGVVPGVAVAGFEFDGGEVGIAAGGAGGEDERAVGLADGLDDVDVAGAE